MNVRNIYWGVLNPKELLWCLYINSFFLIVDLNTWKMWWWQEEILKWATFLGRLIMLRIKMTKKKLNFSSLASLLRRFKICCDDQTCNGCGKTSCQSCKSKSNISNCTWPTVVRNRKANSMELDQYLWWGKLCDHDGSSSHWNGSFKNVRYVFLL